MPDLKNREGICLLNPNGVLFPQERSVKAEAPPAWATAIIQIYEFY